MTTSVTFPPDVGGDGSTVTDDDSVTTGLGNGGFRTRLLPMFTNMINIATQNQTTMTTLSGDAATSATAAAASAATAIAAPGTNATSTTSITIGTGAQTFTIQTGKAIVNGMWLMIADTATPANWMHGLVTAYNSSTGVLNVTVDFVSGSGTFSTWTMSISAPGTPRPAQTGQAGNFLQTNGTSESWEPVLPTQTGNAGYFLQTNGTAAAWAAAGISTVEAIVTANITLTGYNQYVPVQTAAIGQAVTLPAANTPLPLGGPLYIIDNGKGTYAVGVRDNTGTLLMGIAPGGVAYVGLEANSTTAGVWSINGTNLEPGLVGIDVVLSGSTYTGVVAADNSAGVHIAINSNQSIHFNKGTSTQLYAYIVDNVGKSITTPVLVASAYTAVGAIFQVTSTTFILFYANSTTAYSVILSVSGITLTVGTATSAAISIAQENGYTSPTVVQLTSSLYMASSVNGGVSPYTVSVCAFSVSGTAVTAGSVLVVETLTSTTYAGGITLYALTTTTAAIVYSHSSSGSSPFTPYGAVIAVSGVTCTAGTPTIIGLTTLSSVPSTCLMSPTLLLIGAESSAGTTMYVHSVAISGSSLSYTSFTVETGLTNPAPTALTTYNNRFIPQLLSVSSTQAVFWYNDYYSVSSRFSRVTVLTVSGATVTAGPILYGSLGTAPAGVIGAWQLLPFSATEMLSLVATQTTALGNGLMLQPTKIAGSAATVGYGFMAGDLGQNPPGDVICSKLTGGDYVLSGYYAVPSISVFRNNGDAVRRRGNISVPPMQVGQAQFFQAGGVASNRVVLTGSTTSGPLSSGLSGQRRILSVEIAA